MDNADKSRRSVIYTENVVVGDESSRISSTIVVLLWVVPIFSTILFGGVDSTTWIILSFFWAAIILLWLVEAWRCQGFLINTSRLQIPLIGILLIGLIQLLPLGGEVATGLSTVPVSNALSLDPYGTRFFLLRLVVYIVFFAGCLTFINRESRLKKIVLLVIIFGAIMAFFGILQRLANPDGIYGLRGTPQAIPFGPFVNQHHFAAFMEMTAGVAIALMLGKKTGRDKSILLAFAVVVMGAATVLTSSRGGVLSFVSVAAFVGVINLFSGRWSGKKGSVLERSNGIQRNAAVAAGGAALILVIVGLVLFLGGNESLFRGIGATDIQDGVSNGRAHFWPIALSIFLEHPIIGAGLDAFGVAFTKHDTWNGLLRVEQAHNEYLQTLADAGIAGFICIIGFIYFLFRTGWGTIANAGGFRRDAAIGALAGCFGILIHSFVDFPLRTPSNTFFFLLLCAIATVPIVSDRSKSSRRVRRSSGP